MNLLTFEQNQLLSNNCHGRIRWPTTPTIEGVPIGRVWEGLPETKCLQNLLKQLLVFAFEQGHRAKVLAKLAPDYPSLYLLPSVGDIGRTTSGHSSDLKAPTSKPDAIRKFG
jgi:hypothetical protein